MRKDIKNAIDILLNTIDDTDDLGVVLPMMKIFNKPVEVKYILENALKAIEYEDEKYSSIISACDDRQIEYEEEKESNGEDIDYDNDELLDALNIIRGRAREFQHKLSNDKELVKKEDGNVGTK